MTSLLQGKTGLIFGVANDRSYAWHIADALIANGGRCAFAHLPGVKNERRTRLACEKFGGDGDLWLHPCDALKDEDLDAIFDAYTGEHERLDFIIHSIAYAEREWLNFGKFTETPREAYLGAIDISAYTLAAMAHRATEPMKASGGGSIVAMSYYGSEKIVPGYNIMGVAKAALECTMRYLAGDLGQYNIRVNTISGGPLKTLASSAVGGIGIMLNNTPQRAPLRRNVEGTDVGGAAVFLVSDLASGITAENIYVDCGLNVMGV